MTYDRLSASGQSSPLGASGLPHLLTICRDVRQVGIKCVRREGLISQRCPPAVSFVLSRIESKDGCKFGGGEGERGSKRGSKSLMAMIRSDAMTDKTRKSIILF